MDPQPEEAGLYQEELDQLHRLAVEAKLPVFLVGGLLRCSIATAEIWLERGKAALPEHVRQQAPIALTVLTAVEKKLGVEKVSTWMIRNNPSLNQQRPIDVISANAEEPLKALQAALE